MACSLMDDLIAFLKKRYAEIEQHAEAAGAESPSPWMRGDSYTAAKADRDGETQIYDATGDVVVYDEGAPGPAVAGHIVLQDPASTLADIASKRQILAQHRTKVFERLRGSPEFGYQYWCETCHVPSDQPGRKWCVTVRLLAQPFAGHRDFREEWAV